jgi:phosphate transport system substrate-binding protein
MKNAVSKLFVLTMVLAVVLSACAQAAPATEAPVVEAPATEVVVAEATVAVVEPTVEAAPVSNLIALPEVDPAALTGNIVAAGSSTVFPLAEAIAENFNGEGFGGEITVDSIGSGAGFERFCKTGEIDIANASRGIKDTEKEACAALTPARTPIEFRVGTDALAVVVSAENDFLTNVTTEELAKIFSSDATKWSDVNPAWPAEDILRFSPGTDSGTYTFFLESVMQMAYDKEAAEGMILNSANIQFSEDDNVLVQGVEGSKYAIGYFGYAYFKENEGKLKAVSVNDVTPSFETAEDGSYSLSRPLYIYSDASILKAKPQVAGFINYFLTYVNDEIQGVGYFPASDEALNVSRQALLDALK